MFLRHAWLAACVLLWCARAACAQDDAGSAWFVRAGATPAEILGNNPFESAGRAQSEPINWLPNLTVEVGRQTDGSQDWHHLYGLPAYGLGFSVARFHNGAEHGDPLEAYTFFSWPVVRMSDRLGLTTDFGMGLSWHWQDHNQQTDGPVLGSDVNVRINWGFFLRYVTTPRISIYSGIDFTHRSNGGTVQPDRGINVLGPKLSLLYRFAPDASSHAARPSRRPPFRPSWEVVFGGAGALKNIVQGGDPVQRRDFGVFQATSGLQRQFYRYGKIAVGTELTYDGATGAKLDLANGTNAMWRPDAERRWAVGVYSGYEHVIGRFGAIVQVGYNVARGFDPGPEVPRLYQRFAWRYHVNDRLWTMIAVRSIEGRKADFLEFGAGYRLRWPGGDGRRLTAAADPKPNKP